MALSDILGRIASDAAAEARAIEEAASAEAEAMLAAATRQAEEAAARIERESGRAADRDAETMLAGARLTVRDAEVGARGELIDRALVALEERIAALPDDTYTAFIARAVVEAAAGDETVCVAAADSRRLSGLKSAIDALAAEQGQALLLRFSDEAADVAHGVVLIGDRSSNDLSVAGIIQARRDDLVMKLASALFGGGKDGA